jgi:phage shock protein E
VVSHESSGARKHAAYRPLGGWLLTATLCLAALAAQAREIEPDRAAAAIEDGALVLDVRSAEEVEESSLLAGARHAPHRDTEAMLEAAGPDTERTLVVYCRTGSRSAIAIEALRQAGYSSLINAGGYRDLKAVLERR